ncbi:hypothetical protein O6H91_20G070600 [Diphasiastrum complanatum]|uniref:Uncharacterized protein n=1 Tax=Diphasiastrum complanatum TaxID=34168 RepID=A0ACC2ASL1_DIPCM|nr:hypothetical protein O6H91_20G070600 [Diphasiastrum complanatum]
MAIVAVVEDKTLPIGVGSNQALPKGLFRSISYKVNIRKMCRSLFQVQGPQMAFEDEPDPDLCNTNLEVFDFTRTLLHKLLQNLIGAACRESMTANWKLLNYGTLEKSISFVPKYWKEKSFAHFGSVMTICKWHIQCAPRVLKVRVL